MRSQFGTTATGGRGGKISVTRPPNVAADPPSSIILLRNVVPSEHALLSSRTTDHSQVADNPYPLFLESSRSPFLGSHFLIPFNLLQVYRFTLLRMESTDTRGSPLIGGTDSKHWSSGAEETREH